MGFADSADNVRIGSPSHLGRNLGILIALAAAVAGVVAYQMHAGKRNAERLAQFDTFRAAYAEACNAPAFAKEPPDVVRDEYLGSEPIQLAIAQQTAAIKSGNTTCETVAKALKAVDFTVPPPGPLPQ
jgi:hypothetical protein